MSGESASDVGWLIVGQFEDEGPVAFAWGPWPTEAAARAWAESRRNEDDGQPSWFEADSEAAYAAYMAGIDHATWSLQRAGIPADDEPV